jgi:hypothetical protein
VQRSSDSAVRSFLFSVPSDGHRSLFIDFTPALDVPFDPLDAIEILLEEPDWRLLLCCNGSRDIP